MKNYQQTPKQRRANLEKAKRELRHSNPKRQFAQVYRTGYWSQEIHNTVSYRGHKL